MGLASNFRNLLTVISPKLHAYVVYFVKYKKPLHLKNPQSFSEKVIKLKLEDYNNNPLVKQCADKYAVREYVEQAGCGELLNELIGVIDHPDELDWEGLPQQFVLKLNVGCGCNYICTDKSKEDKSYVLERLESWMNVKPWLGYSEMQYKTEKKILIEKFLSDSNGNPPVDYKVYCFNGQPEAILYIDGRFSDEMHAGFFDTSWQYLGIKQNFKKPYKEFDKGILPQKPQSLDQMIAAAQALSAGFPFVRADFFEVNGNPVFGELTFTPSGGFEPSEVDINGKSMAELLDVSYLNDRC